MRFLCVLVVGCSSGWSPPPEDAVARCDYRRVDGQQTSTLHFDDRGRVIQADGYHRSEQVSRTFEYDEQDRLVRADDVRITYTPTEILERGDDTYRYVLDDQGRVVRYHGPLSLPEDKQSSDTFEYDAAGRIVRTVLTRLISKEGEPPHPSSAESHYTYDDRGRVVTAVGFFANRALRYTETGTELQIEDRGARWVVARDDQQRLTAVNIAGDGKLLPLTDVIEYSYEPGMFHERQTTNGGPRELTATGACPAPDVELVPRAVAPSWSAEMVRPVFPQFLFKDFLERYH